MAKPPIFTEDQLNEMSREQLIELCLMTKKISHEIAEERDSLFSTLVLMNQRTYGRKTEASNQIPGQMSLFNEAEVHADNSPEPRINDTKIPRPVRKKKTTRQEILKDLPVEVYDHELSEEELAEIFPNGYKEITPETYQRLSIIPRTMRVCEHRVHIYTSKDNDGRIVRADRPVDLFRNSLATPELVATILTGKYVNHLPLERQSKEFKLEGVKLETNTLSNWVIKSADLYLFSIYEELKKSLLECRVVHADETPLQVTKDGRNAGAKSYMWVYRSGECNEERPAVVYDYQKTRNSEHPKTFLKGYSGTLVCDGYSAYKKLEADVDEIKTAGCWVHARRYFANIVKSASKQNIKDTIAGEAYAMINEIFAEEKKRQELTDEAERNAQDVVLKKKVDEYFAWAKRALATLALDSNTAKGLNYSINHEKALRVFLENPDVPMHNNRAEQAIRPFAIGRKNWVNIDTPRGAEASAIIYSLVETAKANNLHTYEYFRFLLEELPKHADDTDRSFIADLLPWSENVQKRCSNTAI